MHQYVTHHFAHRETLERARYWLAQLGLDPAMMELGTGRDHRITLPVERSMVPMVTMLFDALELGEQAGWQDHKELVQQAHVTLHHPEPPARSASDSAIGWHPMTDAVESVETADITE